MNAMNPKQQLPYLEKNFLSDTSNTQKWLNYMAVLKKGREREYLSEKAKTYFATQTDDQLISENNWLIISNCVTDIQSREFQLLLRHRKQFEALSSPVRVERKVNSIVTELLKPYTASLDTINYYKQQKQDWFRLYLLPTGLKILHRAIDPIRSSQGIVAIFDNRVNQRSYGQQILATLSPSARINYPDLTWLDR